MTRRLLTLGSLATLCLALTGCGGGETTSPNATQAATATPRANAASFAAVAPRGKPEVVVNEFLDLVRRGGQSQTAMAMLTAQARRQLAAIGASVQEIGSPEAQFEVTRSQVLAEDADSALVHSLWREPDPTTGQPVQQAEIVWAVQHEVGGWRISRFALQMDGEAEPTVVNFEDMQDVAWLSGAPGDTIDR